MGARAISPTFDGKRTIPSPKVTDLMLDLLSLSPGDKVLEIGTGSGYQTERLAQTGAEIHSIELEPWLDAVNLDGCTAVYLHAGDGRNGLPHEAPFRAIVASCGLEEIPQAWSDQLENGGRLVAPIGDSKVQRLTLFVKDGYDLRPFTIAAYVRFQMMRSKPEVKELKPRYGESIV